jgi:hypothetical protein
MDENLPNTNNRQEIETPAPLQDTVWKWNSVTLKFINAAQAQLSGETLSYSFNEAAMSGSVDTAGDFSISEDFITLTFANYKNTGTPRSFVNPNASLAGSTWRFGKAVIRFFSPIKVLYQGSELGYTFDSDTKTGSIPDFGTFTIENDTLTFSHYRRSTKTVSFEKRLEMDSAYTNSVIGTAWGWNNAYNGWMVIEFITPETAILTHTNSSYHDNIPLEYPYTATGNSGTIEVLGAFAASSTLLSFPQWKDYPHGADYTRIGE